MVGKCSCKEVAEAASDRLAPLQVGVAVPGGAEAAIHVARQWFTRNRGDRDKVFAKLDLSSAYAFNTLDRRAILRAVHEDFPALAPWADWCYGSPSLLFLGKQTLRSECGVQRGDPLGPLLFSLALQRCAETARRSLRELAQDADLELTFFYLDDGCAAGDRQAVARFLHLVVAELAAVGLNLSTGPGKCEVVPAAGADSNVSAADFPPGFRLRTDGCLELLGAPIGGDDFCRKHAQKRVKKAAEVLDALAGLENAQVGLHLLRQCASYCKLGYSARVVPPSAHTEALLEMDAAVRSCLEQLACASLADDSWAQAQLNLNKGGLGLRSAEKHSPAAYLSSRAKNGELCRPTRAGYANDDAGVAGALTATPQAHAASVTGADRAPSFDGETHSNQKILGPGRRRRARHPLEPLFARDARAPRPRGRARRQRAPAGATPRGVWHSGLA